MRASGIARPAAVAAVVLETEGTISIIPDSGAGNTGRDIDTLATVQRYRSGDR